MNTPVVKNPNLREIKYQTVFISVNAAAGANSHADYSVSFETDKQYERVIGVGVDVIPSAAGVNTDNLRWGKFEIQGREIYANGTPVKRLIMDEDSPVNNRYDREINEEGNGTKVNITLSEYNSGTFVAYTIAVTLMLSNRVSDIPKEGPKA